MSNPQARGGSAPNSGSRYGNARVVSRAVAERERGRQRLKAATAAVSFASVAVAGVVAATLPGSAHSSVSPVKSSSSHSASDSNGSDSSNGSSSSNSSNSSNYSRSSNNSSNLQAPSSVPVQSGGSAPVSTSGGTGF